MVEPLGDLAYGCAAGVALSAMGIWDEPAGAFPAALGQDGLLARLLASVYGNRVIPTQRGTAEEAGAALYGMTGIPDMQAGAQAMGRGEYLPGFGQMAFGFGSLGALGAPVARGAMTVGREALGAVPGVLADTRGAIRAFHGSPYDFDRFDISKVGTGEGAQAYGHGLYFAESEPVARSYKENLGAMGAFSVIDEFMKANRGRDLPVSDIALRLHDTRAAPLATDDRAVQAIRDLLPNYDPGAAVTGTALNRYRYLNDAVERLLPGRMYEARINAEPEQFLDWDKPLGQQSEGVREALKRGYGQVTTRPVGDNPNLGPLHDLLVNGESIGAFPAAALEGKDLTQVAMTHDPRTGKALYEDMARRLAEPHPNFNTRNPYEAATALNEGGIPGIRYLDQGSRNPGFSSLTPAQLDARINSLKGDLAGGGGNQQRMSEQLAALERERDTYRNQTHNYVVFDDKLIDIVRKYGLAGLMAAGSGTALPGMGER